ncbi:MAG: hypothetical protein QF464_08420 [Myxococcota bacterium]|nr:hypothetical protein [Myxococcota bacterium]
MRKTVGWLLAVFGILCLLVLPAHAGIIITEGKVASDKASNGKSKSGRRGASTSPAGTPDGGDETECDELDEEGFCVQTDDTVDGVDVDGLGDLDTDDPEGWDCVSVGGGVQYCEPAVATGSSPGAGAGGGLAAGAGMEGDGGSASHGPQGCQGGDAGTGWSLLFALLALAFGHLRRRESRLLA